jgi:ergothioneine biosynthesis protein EgtB
VQVKSQEFNPLTLNTQRSTLHFRQQLKTWMEECRQSTLSLFEGMDYDTFCRQAHPDFSPVGWHLGHIAYTEYLWLLEHLAGFPPQSPEYRRLFAADGLPKCDRVHLPTLPEVQAYLETVRSQVFDYLEVAPLDEQERLWRWLLQHESQHCETIAIVLELMEWHEATVLQNSKFKIQNSKFDTQTRGTRYEKIQNPKSKIQNPDSPMLQIPAGPFAMGSDAIDALDNERPIHQVDLETYWIDRHPVTCQQYRTFMAAGGYQNPEWWSPQGWQWLQDHPVTQPLYWQEGAAFDDQPVCGVNWYEAEAYARFVGKRLPTEAEWEKATHWNADNMLGQVWEWTDSWFAGYSGFTAYPYRGYSQAYFDGQHRVLRGGSWATRRWVLRPTFRNWYHPHVREIFAGFRCVTSALLCQLL